MQANNAMVRANAASLLFDAFPLLPPSDNARHELDELLQRQFEAIDNLLMDDYAQVRSISNIHIIYISLVTLKLIYEFIYKY